MDRPFHPPRPTHFFWESATMVKVRPTAAMVGCRVLVEQVANTVESAVTGIAARLRTKQPSPWAVGAQKLVRPLGYESCCGRWKT